MRPWVKWLGALVALLVVAVVVVILFFDWNWLRAPLEARLSAATGKRVSITGPIQGEYTWTPLITLEGIKLEAPEWKPDPQVGSIDKVELTIELKKLLTGTLSIPTLRIIKPVMVLERRGDKANWDIAQEASGPSDRGSFPLIGDITVTNGAIAYRDPKKHLSIDGTIATLKGNGTTGDGKFTLDGKGTYQKAPFTLKVNGDSLLHLRDAKAPYKIDVTADLGNTHIIAGGTLGDPIKMTDLSLGLQVRGDNAADLYPYLGIPAPTTPPYHLGGTLARDSRDIWAFRDFGGTVGTSDLSGALTFDLGKDRLFISGVLYSKILNLADLGVVAGVPTKPAGNAPVNAEQKKVTETYARSDRVLPDAPLQIDAVRNVDMDVNFKGAKVQAQDIPLERIDMQIKTDHGVMTLDPIQMGIGGGLMRGTAVIDARGDIVKSDVDLRLTEFKVERFLDPKNTGNAAVTGAIDGRLRFQGTGDSLRKALATADGTASAIIDEGSISKLSSALLGLDVARALGVLISGDKKIGLNCVVTDFQIKNGVMTPRAFIADTDNMYVAGKGTINLADERIDLQLKGQPKGATLSLRGPILLKGTFRHPDVGIGTEAYVRAGGSVLLGAILAPLAAIITFIDSGKKHDADCGALETVAQQSAAKTPPVNKTPPPPQRAAKVKALPPPKVKPTPSAPPAAPAAAR